MNNKGYNIDEIKSWLSGLILLDGSGNKIINSGNRFVEFLITEIEDQEDGIDAVTFRNYRRQKIPNIVKEWECIKCGAIYTFPTEHVLSQCYSCHGKLRMNKCYEK